jgi:hypothetical protein
VNSVVRVSIAIGTAALLLPAAALGKGASEAAITGPGLDGPITLAGEGQPRGEELMQIAEEAGFFPAVFSQVPDQMLDARPDSALGPKYRVEYVMPGPNNEEDRLVQDVYPYATPSPVSYVEPGQRFWTTEQTRGGWFVGTQTLRDLLVAAGLPASAPSDEGTPSDSPWFVFGPILGLVGAGMLGGLAIALLRRRPQTGDQTRTVTAPRSAS